MAKPRKRRRDPETDAQQAMLIDNAKHRVAAEIHRIENSMESFGLSLGQKYTITTTVLLDALMKQFLEVHHLQGNFRGVKRPTDSVVASEETAKDVVALVAQALDVVNDKASYTVHFTKRDL